MRQKRDNLRVVTEGGRAPNSAPPAARERLGFPVLFDIKGCGDISRADGCEKLHENKTRDRFLLLFMSGRYLLLYSSVNTESRTSLVSVRSGHSLFILVITHASDFAILHAALTKLSL